MALNTKKCTKCLKTLSTMVVDHIITPCGKNISGFHVLENLQYLTWDENAIKSNIYIGENHVSI